MAAFFIPLTIIPLPFPPSFPYSVSYAFSWGGRGSVANFPAFPLIVEREPLLSTLEASQGKPHRFPPSPSEIEAPLRSETNRNLKSSIWDFSQEFLNGSEATSDYSNRRTQ